jgi:SAM-dependent methyltransferase
MPKLGPRSAQGADAGVLCPGRSEGRRVSEVYHRGELAIALDTTHPSHVLPPPVPPSARVLDIGCGAGQTLLAAYGDRPTFGVDVDHDALRLGTAMAGSVRFVRAAAEALPWRDGQFDLVVARVSLPYTDLRRSLAEARRVLRDGGMLWMTLHGFSTVWRQAKRGRSVKGWAYFVYVVANTFLFSLAHRQIRLLGRMESFQNEGSIRAALRAAGFHEIDVRRERHFVVTARTTNRRDRGL